MTGYLTVAQASERLGLSVRRVRQMVESGALAGERLGPRLWAIPENAVADYQRVPRGRPRRVVEG